MLAPDELKASGDNLKTVEQQLAELPDDEAVDIPTDPVSDESARPKDDADNSENIEYRTPNVEVRHRRALFLLRHSTFNVRHSTFCSSSRLPHSPDARPFRVLASAGRRGE